VTTWRSPDLDQASAEALSIVSLYSTGREADSVLAGALLDEFTGTPEEMARIIGGLVSVAAALLILHEYETSSPPEASLQKVGKLIATSMVRS
jgi:hypothetical protein